MHVAALRRAVGSHPFFFARVVDFLQRPRDCALTHATPPLSEFSLRFVVVRTHECFKLLPIGDFAARLHGLSQFRLDVSSRSFALTPQVNRIATDVKQLACLALFQPIEFDGLHHFAPEVVTVGFCHAMNKRQIHNSFSLRPNLSDYSYS